MDENQNNNLPQPPAPGPEKAVNLDDRDSDFNLAKDTGFVRFQPNHALMARPKLRERDLKPQRIFFYFRYPDERVMIYTEAEAALMIKSSHGPILKQLGVGDGKTYQQFIRNCGVKPGQVIPRAQAEKILADAFNAELEAAKGHYANPQDQNVHFDDSFPVDQRQSFVPPK